VFHGFGQAKFWLKPISTAALAASKKDGGFKHGQN